MTSLAALSISFFTSSPWPESRSQITALMTNGMPNRFSGPLINESLNDRFEPVLMPVNALRCAGVTVDPDCTFQTTYGSSDGVDWSCDDSRMHSRPTKWTVQETSGTKIVA